MPPFHTTNFMNIYTAPNINPDLDCDQNLINSSSVPPKAEAKFHPCPSLLGFYSL